MGLEKCIRILELRPKWTRPAAKPQIPGTTEERKLSGGVA
jgi:hypothetical protein